MSAPHPALPFFLREQADRAEAKGRLSDTSELRQAAEELEVLRAKPDVTDEELQAMRVRAATSQHGLTQREALALIDELSALRAKEAPEKAWQRALLQADSWSLSSGGYGIPAWEYHPPQPELSRCTCWHPFPWLHRVECPEHGGGKR